MQIFDWLTSIASAPGWLRLILSLGLLLYTVRINNQHSLPNGKFLLAVAAVLIGRDLLSIWIISPALFIVSDFAVYALYGWWLSAYLGRRRDSFAFTVGGGAIIVAVVVLNLLVDAFSWNLVNLVFVGVYVWFAILFQRVSFFQGTKQEFIMNNRMDFIVVFAIARVLFFLDASYTGFALVFVLPLTYVGYFLIIYRYHLYFAEIEREQDEFNTSYINSLFDFMRTIGNAMHERIEVKSVLKYILRIIVRYTDAEAGCVLVRDANTNDLQLSFVEGYYPPPFKVPDIVKSKLTGVQRYFESTPLKMGETVLGKVALDNRPIFIRNSQDSDHLADNKADDTLFISSLIAIPLVVNNEVFGVISVIHRSKKALFSDLEYERSKIFTEYASLTLDNLYTYSQLLEKQEIEREVNIAADIQKKLLPTKTPKHIRENVHAYSIPAKGVSGDYYDVIPLNRAGKIAIVICDVAGKGVPASLIMVMIRTIIHLIAGSNFDAAKVINLINRGIAGRIDIERFATLSYFTYDPITRMMDYSNAGHHPAMLLRKATNAIERIDVPGLPIGLERDAQYVSKQVELNPGDLVMLYTDGIIEALSLDNEQYEEERLTRVFTDHSDDDPETLVKRIKKDIDDFVGFAKQHDDQTIIIMRA